jgi:hypothetical protein
MHKVLGIIYGILKHEQPFDSSIEKTVKRRYYVILEIKSSTPTGVTRVSTKRRQSRDRPMTLNAGSVPRSPVSNITKTTGHVQILPEEQYVFCGITYPQIN